MYISEIIDETFFRKLQCSKQACFDQEKFIEVSHMLHKNNLNYSDYFRR